MEIRKYDKSDLEQIIELFYNTVTKVNCKDYNQAQLNVWAKHPDTIDRTVWHQQFDSSNTFVAIEDDQVVGFVNIFINGYLDKLYVHHNYLRQGIATVLCNEAEGIVSNGIKVDSSITALEFFTKRGYQLVTEEQKIINHVLLTRYKLKKA